MSQHFLPSFPILSHSSKQTSQCVAAFPLIPPNILSHSFKQPSLYVATFPPIPPNILSHSSWQPSQSVAAFTLIHPNTLSHSSKQTSQCVAAFPPISPNTLSHSSHELPLSFAANCLDRPLPYYSFRSRSSARTFPICRPRFPFCSLTHSPVNLSPTLLPRHVSSFIFFWFLPHLSSISL